MNDAKGIEYRAVPDGSDKKDSDEAPTRAKRQSRKGAASRSK
jgi:hypothetical protein